MRTALGLLALWLAAPSFAAELFIDLRTDWSHSTEFAYVRTEMLDRTDERNQWATVQRIGGDFISGVRVAEFSNVSGGRNYTVTVELLDDRLRTVDGELTILSMPNTDFGMISVIARP